MNAALLRIFVSALNAINAFNAFNAFNAHNAHNAINAISALAKLAESGESVACRAGVLRHTRFRSEAGWFIDMGRRGVLRVAYCVKALTGAGGIIPSAPGGLFQII